LALGSGSGENGERPVKALNLFGYTGMMSLALAKAGADVVHLDASPKSIAQGRENAEMSGLAGAPIRWICDDAMKFVEREIRRGSKYDAIVLDPPKFGRGPKNETWRFETDFPKLLEHTQTLMSDKPLFVIATVYAVRLSYAAVGQSLAGAMGGGKVQCGEMAIREARPRSRSANRTVRPVDALRALAEPRDDRCEAERRLAVGGDHPAHIDQPAACPRDFSGRFHHVAGLGG
jgi:23S rRNA G2069 N7-methylase RlmK/C1962 C5-methylase RlmI